MNLRDLTDGELLARFVATEDTEPFEELYHRHAAAALRICARAAGRSSDAEDVLQSVFLLLASKAATLTERASVAGWLHRVAWHTGLRYRRSASTRRRHEYIAAALRSDADATDPMLASEATRELHEELNRLPDEYGDAIVLHHIHGLSVQETAKVLRENAGTVAARLSRGRAMLSERLKRRGLAVAAGVSLLLLGHLYEKVAANLLTVPQTMFEVGGKLSRVCLARALSGTGAACVLVNGATGVVAAGPCAVSATSASVAGIATTAGMAARYACAGGGNGFVKSVLLKCALAMSLAGAAVTGGVALGNRSDHNSKSAGLLDFVSSAFASDSHGGVESDGSGGRSSGTSVPEPSSAMLFCGASALLLRRRRRAAGI